MEVETTGDGYFRGAAEKQKDMDQRKCDPGAALPPPSSSSSSSSANGCFDCNICLDFTVEPVVTLCGHLYCWSCIYKWLQQQVEGQQCPVCKASLSINALVPLYGRGHTTTTRSHQRDVPRRPSILREPEPPTVVTDLHRPPILQHRRQHYHHDRAYYGYPYGDHSSPPSSPRMDHSMAGGVLGGMAIAVLPWVFRNQEAGVGSYYSSPYQMAGSRGGEPSTRLRRQEMQVERLLHQICVLLFCCAVLCLLFF